ncbi:hypothetical protein [Halomonas lysinitropha]|uniref:Uncharacterized protein n=1 Tax=Halomonas lysinitropha TaxID=2607506 RepID=A0A5K1I1F0_9GAMM|nr:hypothetical protein [Halomonas lysinitropha]VVZ95534.1 hypothetical protein HALO32_01605 [Halomonas lysinitropha]
MKSDILTSAKPDTIDEWLLDTQAQEEFVNSLVIYLAHILAVEISGVTIKQCVVFFQSKLAIKQFEQDPDADGLEELDIELSRSDKSLLVHGVHFPASDPRLGCDYHLLLESIPGLVFVNCHFYCESLFDRYTSTRYRFQDCTFHFPWSQQEETSGPGPDYVLFEACDFKQGVSFSGDDIGSEPLHSCRALFQDCFIDGELSLYGLKSDIPVFFNNKAHKQKIEKIAIEGCEFGRRFTLANTDKIREIDLSNTVFNDKFALINAEISCLRIRNVNFNGLADLFQSKFGSLLVRKSIFRDFAGFENCQFGVAATEKSKILLQYVSFYSFTNFRGGRFLLPLDLRNTNFKEQPNFLGCHFDTVARKQTDRETFRIIKQSFEAVGNRIEANAFYALEMEAYRRELRCSAKEHGWTWRYWERLLVKINYVISLHGQSYWRPLLLIVFLVSLVSLQRANYEQGWLVLPAAVSSLVTPVVDILNAWANGFVLFRSLYTHYPGHEAFILFISFLLSTCVWHFLVAVRRHHRR